MKGDLITRMFEENGIKVVDTTEYVEITYEELVKSILDYLSETRPDVTEWDCEHLADALLLDYKIEKVK